MILVRHAMPEVVPGVPPHEWELGAAGRAAARDLARRLDGRLVVTSDEPKARQTAEEIADHLGAEMVLDHRLAEPQRPGEWDDNYREQARRYIGGDALAGWEPHADVSARFSDAARGDIVVTHGLALTLYLGEGVEFWEALRFPDAWSALAGQLRRVD